MQKYHPKSEKCFKKSLLPCWISTQSIQRCSQTLCRLRHHRCPCLWYFYVFRIFLKLEQLKEGQQTEQTQQIRTKLDPQPFSLQRNTIGLWSLGGETTPLDLSSVVKVTLLVL